MPLLYSVVARGSTVLAKYASCAGNFAEVTEQILNTISPENGKLTYSYGNYLFHYVLEETIIYLCITDDDFERSRAFLYLDEIKKRFQTSYGERARTALPFAMNSEFSRILATEMKHYSEARNFDKVSKVQGQLDELKDIMVKNIDDIASRGEKLELLVSKADDLCSESVEFRVRSRGLARSLYWKNIKLILISSIIIIMIVYFIISAACGGLAWQKCV